jgi:hypothetical protein
MDVIVLNLNLIWYVLKNYVDTIACDEILYMG